MKKLFAIIIANCCFVFIAFGQNTTVSFRSSDNAMQNAFTHAKEMALHYQGNTNDPVGPWYEAALPSREAFCMRDASHQCIAAEVLGMSLENKNMFSLFVKNISKNKDWCSYWEINKYGLPAPADYRNDKEFWYNLNANFDLIYACLRLYSWTSDESYIKNQIFTNFYEKSVNEYIDKWVLHADSLLIRPAFPIASVNFNINDNFHRCRGLASYSEDVSDLKIGVDLIAAIYRGLLSYSYILKLNGDTTKAAYYEKKANSYQEKIDLDWWNNTDSLYNTYYTIDGKFGKGNGEVFLLWFDVVKDNERVRKTIDHLISEDLNVETQSYFPVILYKHGLNKEARDYIIHLASPETKRREYPEVSFGVIEGIVQGLMGIEPDAESNRISTIYRGQNGTLSELDSFPSLGTNISLKHESQKSYFNNNGKTRINWTAQFAGNYKYVFVNNKRILAQHKYDISGNPVSYIDTMVESGKKMIAICTK